MPAEVLADDETIERTDIAVDETLLEPVLGSYWNWTKMLSYKCWSSR